MKPSAQLGVQEWLKRAIWGSRRLPMLEEVSGGGLEGGWEVEVGVEVACEGVVEMEKELTRDYRVSCVC